MGRREDSKAAIGAIHRHVDTITDVCYLSQGQIDENADNNTLIGALQKNKLAYPIDGISGYQLHGKVRGLFDHVTRRHRYRESHGRLAGLLDDLDNAIVSYRHSKTKAHKDSDFLLSEVREVVMDIMDTLSDTVEMFANVVNDEFSVVSDINERIRQTKRCLADISKINTIFESLGIEHMQQWVSVDLALEQLLMKVLKSHVDRCLTDLSASSRKLNTMLSKLITSKQFQHTNRLIDAFSGKFKKEPGYRPDIESLENIPDCFACAGAIQAKGYADIDSARDEELLIELAKAALEKSELPKGESDAETVGATQNNMDSEELEVVDPFIECVELFFDALMAEEGPDRLSAITAYEKLEVDGAIEDWLLAIHGYYAIQKKAIDPTWRLKESVEIEMPYSGTYYLSNMTFIRRGVE